MDFPILIWKVGWKAESALSWNIGPGQVGLARLCMMMNMMMVVMIMMRICGDDDRDVGVGVKIDMSWAIVSSFLNQMWQLTGMIGSQTVTQTKKGEE